MSPLSIRSLLPGKLVDDPLDLNKPLDLNDLSSAQGAMAM